MPFAQLVIGPPGSGKTTYCNGMHQFLSAIGRKCSVVNLDPANEQISYPCAVDIRSLTTVDDIMRDESLGPNGAMLYALEELELNVEWLQDRLKSLGEDYVLFDCPGQVELFTHHESLRNIIFKIQKFGYRLIALHLTDSISLTQPSLYISTVLLSLRAMLQTDLPHLNILTKIDKIASYGPLPFNLDFYTEVHDLSYLLPHLSAENARLRHPKFEGLNKAVVELVEEFGLVSFETLAVENKRSMMTLLQAIDRASGYVFGGAEGANDTVWQVAMREDTTGMTIQDVQERWIDRKEELDELEDQEAEEALKAEGAQDGPTHSNLADASLDPDDFGGDMPMAGSGVKIVRKGQT